MRTYFKHVHALNVEFLSEEVRVSDTARPVCIHAVARDIHYPCLFCFLQNEKGGGGVWINAELPLFLYHFLVVFSV